jgi:hypothetical protein
VVAALICSAVIGAPPATIWSSSSSGIFGSAAVLAAIAAFFVFGVSCEARVQSPLIVTAFM